MGVVELACKARQEIKQREEEEQRRREEAEQREREAQAEALARERKRLIASGAPMEDLPKPEPCSGSFRRQDGRWFVCNGCGTTKRVRKAPYKAFLSGTPLALLCNTCGGSQVVRKEA